MTDYETGSTGTSAGEVPLEVPPALHERRPDWVRNMVDENYDSEHAWPHNFSMLGANGAERGYDFGPHDSPALADGLRTELGRPLRVLDVGTGTGIPVVYHIDQGDTAQGITAFDYRVVNPFHVFKNNNEAYLVANAETMDGIKGLASGYDLVMSRRTLHHLIDTLGTFEQMANRTAPGGILCIDAFEFTDNDEECQVAASHVVTAMRLAGFEPLETTPIDEQALAAPALPVVVWRRQPNATLPVRIPVRYALDSHGKLTYRLTT